MTKDELTAKLGKNMKNNNHKTRRTNKTKNCN